MASTCSYSRMAQCLQRPAIRLTEAAIVLALAAHLAGGIRLLLVELVGWRGERQKSALAVGLAAGGVIGLLGQVRPRERLPAPSPPPGVLNAGPAPSVAPAEASTLLLWTPGGLPQGFARAAAANESPWTICTWMSRATIAASAQTRSAMNVMTRANSPLYFG